MTTYYVSQQVGSDSNAGTGPGAGSAWLTLGKAATDADTAGDIIYIGPGTYREMVDLSYSGSSGSPIKWIADPECEHLTSDKPGIVRWTAANSSEAEGTDSALDFTDEQYVEVYGPIVFDGTYSTSKGTVTRSSYDATCKVYDAIMTGFVGAYGIWAARSMAAGKYGWQSCYCENCIGTGFYAFLCQDGSRNNMAIGSQYGFFLSDTDVENYNCVAVACSVCFYCADTSNTPGFTNCHACYATMGFQNVAKTNCSYAACQIASSGGSGSAPTKTNIVAFQNIDLLRRALEPMAFGSLLEKGNNSYLPTTTDILNRTRQQGTIEIGPYELAVESLGWTSTFYNTNPPGIFMVGIGQKVIQIAAEADTEITISIYAKHNSASTKPTATLRGQTITEETETVTAGNDTWQKLTFTAVTPDVGEVLELVLKSNEAGKLAYFSDIEVA